MMTMITAINWPSTLLWIQHSISICGVFVIMMGVLTALSRLCHLFASG